MPNYSLNSEMGLSDDPLFIKYKLYIKKISFKRPNTHLSLAYKQLTSTLLVAFGSTIARLIPMCFRVIMTS